jgi:drug/metabolite transporter (DMT)-like permease
MVWVCSFSVSEGQKIKTHSLGHDIFLLVLANVLWGGTDVCAKFALSEMTPQALILARLSLALLAFIPVLWLKRREFPRTLRGLAPFVALGLCGFVLDFVFVYQGLRLSVASHATAFRISESLAILTLAVIFLGEKPGAGALLGLLTGMAGVVLVLNIDFKNLALFATGTRLGDLLILAGIFVEAFYTVIGKSVLKKTSPLLSTGLALLLGWVIVSALFGFQVGAEFARKPPSLGAALACAYLGFVATAFAFWIFYDVLSRRDSHRVGISIMIQPVVGIPLAALLFHDPMTKGFLFGTALIALGVYIAFRKSGSEGPAPV